MLWTLAVLTYGVGDLATTIVGLRYDELEEGNSGARLLLGDPPSAVRFGLFKAALFGFCYAGYVALGGFEFRVLFPAAISAVGIYAVVNNVRAIVAVR
ncbi:hypothetical protein EA473_00860 [Natrarchaeobius chitinivorans]|uniref:DUF5658 domain-containing protein n=2 Tax=Natrarchaeobius chitinivorans TaxID=1679083 RepID=A0A3N6M776_NATCH|nr:hypothetical protein [Natrarchaeobius chitinivorans]RQG98087.1 hypothetical protein EA473_00860 [Natrarchaeobius chitinivorans]